MIRISGGIRMQIIIDRFEGEYAVCEKDKLEIIHIKIDQLPQGAKEGDVLIMDGSNIIIDRDKTKKRKETIKKLMDDLWE